MADINAVLRHLNGKIQALEGQNAQLMAQVENFIRACADQPRSITAEIDALPGRRIFYGLVGFQDFTIAQNGLRGAAIPFQISQDGAFIATHYPMVTWRPTTPTNASNFGAWRPVSTWPLPDQVLDTDIIDLSYEVVDAGSQRNFQNSAQGPLFSRPDNAIPLPVPTMFAPNSNFQFFPTYERISFNTAAVATTGGRLVVTWPGYKIVTM